MASRRTRIKGIANIPQRRKLNNTAETEGPLIVKVDVRCEKQAPVEQPNLTSVSNQLSDLNPTPEEVVNVNNYEKQIPLEQTKLTSVSEHVDLNQTSVEVVKGPADSVAIHVDNVPKTTDAADCTDTTVVNNCEKQTPLEQTNLNSVSDHGGDLNRTSVEVVKGPADVVAIQVDNVPNRTDSANGTDTTVVNNFEKQIPLEQTKLTSVSDHVGDLIQTSVEGPADAVAIQVDNVPNTTGAGKSTDTTETTLNAKPKKPAFVRRKFLKPTISVGAINRKPKSNGENGNASEQEKPKITILHNEVVKPNDSLVQSGTISINPPEAHEENEVTLNETQLLPQITPSTPSPKPDVVAAEISVKKFTPHICTTHSSDSEYPPPPVSPSKINRQRIKAIPRLSQRKTSFSASESEDETRRNYIRNRNDSVCSTASGVPESIPECMSPQRPPKEFNSVIQKKCRRTDQSRKLANARLDFYGKFGNNKPDRQKLTMIDLIFYNPTTNPMSYNSKTRKDSEITNEDDCNLVKSEETIEAVDKQNETEQQEQSDEENEMPVPQIKIGPQGEIVLDEQSLVIENKETKKNREEIQKSQLVNGDFDTGYGIYKRVKRAKDWTQTETLRFYKALNTIGTDFSLMCELFPRRSRRELKMKFKKEERINQTLIDKAVMQPCNFDFAELKHDVEMEERELQEIERQKAEDARRKLQKEERLSRKRKGKLKEVVNEDHNYVKPKQVRRSKKRKTLDINSVLEDSDADVSADSPDESVIEVPMRLRPTRSGRVPKITQKFNPQNEEIVKDKPQIEDNGKVESDSLIFVPGEGRNGEKVLQMFMVTPEENASSQNNFTCTGNQGKKKIVQVENILTITATEISVLKENNITIPANNMDVCNDNSSGDNNAQLRVDHSDFMNNDGENDINHTTGDNCS